MFSHREIYLQRRKIFSCASAKAERRLSSLSCVCVCVYVDQIRGNYLRPFQTWRHPSSPNHCKPISQSECRHNKKSCHLLDKKGTHPMRMHDKNTTCNRSNQNASLPDTHSHSTNQHPAAPDTTKTTCYRSAAQC